MQDQVVHFSETTTMMQSKVLQLYITCFPKVFRQFAGHLLHHLHAKNLKKTEYITYFFEVASRLPQFYDMPYPRYFKVF